MKKIFNTSKFYPCYPVFIIAYYNDNQDVYISTMSSSYTLGNMLALGIGTNSSFSKSASQGKAFSINFLDRSQMNAIELGGYISNNISKEKTKLSNLTFSHNDELGTPHINEAALVLECQIESISPFGESYLQIIASIKNRLCEDYLLKEDVFQYEKLDIPLYEGDAKKRVYRFMSNENIAGGTFYKQIISQNKEK